MAALMLACSSGYALTPEDVAKLDPVFEAEAVEAAGEDSDIYRIARCYEVVYRGLTRIYVEASGASEEAVLAYCVSKVRDAQPELNVLMKDFLPEVRRVLRDVEVLTSSTVDRYIQGRRCYLARTWKLKEEVLFDRLGRAGFYSCKVLEFEYRFIHAQPYVNEVEAKRHKPVVEIIKNR